MGELSANKKIIMGGALAVLIAIALFIKLGGGAAAKLTEQMLSRQNVVTGSLTYEKIGSGFAGDVEIRNVVWKAPNGDVKAEIPLTTVSVNFFDILRQGGGLGSVTSIVLNKPQFYGVYEEGQGLDILNLVKLAGSVNLPDAGKKAERPAEPTRFRGLIEIKDGVVKLDSNGKKVELTKLNSQMAFNQYPRLRASATASKSNCDLVLNMDYADGRARVTGEAKKMQVSDLLAMYPDLKNISVTAGELPTVTIACSKDDQGWHIDLDGSPRGMTGKVFGRDFTDGTGKLHVTRDTADIEQLSLKVNGMPVEIEGRIKSGRGTPLPPGYDLDFRAVNFKTQSLSGGLFLKDGALNIAGRLTGTSLEPQLEGTFTGDKLEAGPLVLTEVRGGFRWDFGKLLLQNAGAQCAGAPMKIDGVLDWNSGDYQLALSGEKLDAARLTGNKVTGLLQIRTRIEGKNLTDSAAGEGGFFLENGRLYYMEGGKPKQEEIRFLKGEIFVQNGNFTARNGEIKLGRTKYRVDLLTGEADPVELRLGERLSWSLF